MLDKYTQNAKAMRTPASAIESHALVQSIQQSLSNPTLCSSALGGGNYPFVNVESGSTPQPQPIPALVANLGGPPIVIASPGMISNQVSVATIEQAQTLGIPPLQITGGGSNYVNYGAQPSPGPSGIQGYSCAQANLHIVTSKEIPSSSPIKAQGQSSEASSNRRTMGSTLEQQDIPIALLTDSQNIIRSCFAGPTANICAQAPAPTLSPLTISHSCIDLSLANTATVTWTAASVSSASLVCGTNNIPVTPAQYATGGVVISNSNVSSGTGLSCALTVTNSADVPATQYSSTTFTSTITCTPPAVAISSSNSCVNTGMPFTLNWVDHDDDPAATVVVTGTDGSSYSSSATSGTGALSVTAPASVPPVGTTITYTAVDQPTGDKSNPLAVVTVMPSPVPPILSITNPSPAQYTTDSVPANISLQWTTAGITTATVNGVDGSGNSVGSATSTTGTATLSPAPTAAGTYSYTVTGTGGCPGTPTVTSNAVTLTVTPCNCIAGNSTDSCGNPNPSCPPAAPTGACGGAQGTPSATAPASGLCTTGTASTPANVAGSWSWTCAGGGSPAPCLAPVATASSCLADGALFRTMMPTGQSVFGTCCSTTFYTTQSYGILECSEDPTTGCGNTNYYCGNIAQGKDCNSFVTGGTQQNNYVGSCATGLSCVTTTPGSGTTAIDTCQPSGGGICGTQGSCEDENECAFQCSSCPAGYNVILSNAVLSTVAQTCPANKPNIPFVCTCNGGPLIDGKCGSANGVFTTTIANTGPTICASGQSTLPTQTTPSAANENPTPGWHWDCVGSGGGATVACFAPQTP